MSVMGSGFTSHVCLASPPVVESALSAEPESDEAGLQEVSAAPAAATAPVASAPSLEEVPAIEFHDVLPFLACDAFGASRILFENARFS